MFTIIEHCIYYNTIENYNLKLFDTKEQALKQAEIQAKELKLLLEKRNEDKVYTIKQQYNTICVEELLNKTHTEFIIMEIEK